MNQKTFRNENEWLELQFVFMVHWGRFQSRMRVAYTFWKHTEDGGLAAAQVRVFVALGDDQSALSIY